VTLVAPRDGGGRGGGFFACFGGLVVRTEDDEA